MLETLCRRIEHAGPLGAGARLKLAVNLPLMVYWTALGEALALVSDLEIAPNRLIDLMADTSGTAAVLPRKQEAVTRLVEGADFPPAEFEMRGATKDLAFMVEAARARGIDLPVSSAARSVFEAAAADGMAGEDAIVIAALAYLKSRKS
ncbi:NAD-binding protein [Pelagibacterium montanilacus]|uniref:NAD-binding protein n=1 Tax=Pelagibacterium montanilacus TaxID=2185280 RepID=UPI002482D657|nr:NAD-binding protein [Pelagibacterium montanilacus]